MIEIIEGKGVGAGKSYFAQRRIIRHLAAGGTVFASDTFGMKWEETKAYVAKKYGLVLQDGQYNSFPEADVFRLHEVTPMGTPEMPVLVVVDECHMALNARDWADTKKRPFFNWLTQSRHDDTDVIFISQNAANIDKQVARLVTFIWRCRNMRNFKVLGLGAWPFDQFLFVQLDNDNRTVLHREWATHDKEIFRTYESKIMAGKHKRVANVAVRKLQLAKVEKKPMKIKIIVFAVLLFVAYYGKQAYDRFNGGLDTTKKPVAAETLPPRPAAPAAAAASSGPKVIVEAFRGSVGNAAFTRGRYQPVALATNNGLYALRELSPHGIVEEIRWPREGYPQAVVKCSLGAVITYVVAVKEESVGAYERAAGPVTVGDTRTGDTNKNRATDNR